MKQFSQGVDYAGIVEEIGSKVTNGLKKGDRVAGFAHGGNEVQHEDGAFSEIIVSEHFSWIVAKTTNSYTRQPKVIFKSKFQKT